MKTFWCRYVPVFGLALLLGGCDTARETFGFTKTAPDEFQVVRRAPLALPPDYTLRVPEPGRQRPQESSPTDTARSILTSNRASNRARPQNPARGSLEGGSPGAQVLLRRAGAESADPDIRRRVDRETTVFVKENESFIDDLIFWQKDRGETAVVVNPEAEARRIRNNQALGRPVNEGDVPVIERREKGLLEGIF